MLPIRSLDLVDSNITQTLTGWTYFLHFPVTGRVARAFSGVFYIGSNNDNGVIEGFQVDVINAACAQAGKDCKIVIGDDYLAFDPTLNYGLGKSSLSLLFPLLLFVFL